MELHSIQGSVQPKVENIIKLMEEKIIQIRQYNGLSRSEMTPEIEAYERCIALVKGLL